MSQSTLTQRYEQKGREAGIIGVNHPTQRQCQALKLQNNKKPTVEHERTVLYILLTWKIEKNRSRVHSPIHSFIQQTFLSTYCVAFAVLSPGNMINKKCVALALQGHTVWQRRAIAHVEELLSKKSVWGRDWPSEGGVTAAGGSGTHQNQEDEMVSHAKEEEKRVSDEETFLLSFLLTSPQTYENWDIFQLGFHDITSSPSSNFYAALASIQHLNIAQPHNPLLSKLSHLVTFIQITHLISRPGLTTELQTNVVYPHNFLSTVYQTFQHGFPGAALHLSSLFCIEYMSSLGMHWC